MKTEDKCQLKTKEIDKRYQNKKKMIASKSCIYFVSHFQARRILFPYSFMQKYFIYLQLLIKLIPFYKNSQIEAVLIFHYSSNVFLSTYKIYNCSLRTPQSNHFLSNSMAFISFSPVSACCGQIHLNFARFIFINLILNK